MTEFKILHSVSSHPLKVGLDAPPTAAEPAVWCEPPLVDDKSEWNPAFSVEIPTFFRGRVALYAILKALGVGPGDEVAVPAYTCVAVPEGILALGARPLWIDIKPDTLTIDPDYAETVLHPGVKALIVQHTFGIPCEMDRLTDIARRKGVPMIEDCCHTFRSTFKGKPLGSFGAAAFYSFEWGKPLVAGLGGAAICADQELERRLASVYAEFQDPPLIRDLRIACQYYSFLIGYSPRFYWIIRRVNAALSSYGLGEPSYHSELGKRVNSDFQYRMAHSCRSRLLRHSGRIDAIASHADWVCEQYRVGIRNPGVRLPASLPQGRTVFTRYPLWVTDKARIMAEARKAGMEVAGWYESPVHPLGPSEYDIVSYRAGSCPNAERAVREVVTLPTNQRTSAKNIARTLKLIDEIAL